MESRLSEADYWTNNNRAVRIVSPKVLPIARGALPETTALIGVSPNVGGHITDGDSALTTKFPFRSHCGLIGDTVTRRSAALTSHFPSQQGVDLSCQSVLRHTIY
jgi:hypothetical protein